MGIDDLGPLQEPPAARTRAAAEKSALQDAPERQGRIVHNVAQTGLGLGIRALQWVGMKVFGWVVVLPLVMFIWFKMLEWFFWSPIAFLSWYFSAVSTAYSAIIILLMLGFLAVQVGIVYAVYQYGLRSVQRWAARLHPVRAAMALRRRKRIAASLALGVYAFVMQIIFFFAPAVFSGAISQLGDHFSLLSSNAKIGVTSSMVMSLLLYWLPLLFQWSVISAVGRPPPLAPSGASN